MLQVAVAMASLSLRGVCARKLCLLWPEAERRRGSISIFLRLFFFLPHAVIYQEEPHGKVGRVDFCRHEPGEGRPSSQTQICEYEMKSRPKALTSHRLFGGDKANIFMSRVDPAEENRLHQPVKSVRS